MGPTNRRCGPHEELSACSAKKITRAFHRKAPRFPHPPSHTVADKMAPPPRVYARARERGARSEEPTCPSPGFPRPHREPITRGRVYTPASRCGSAADPTARRPPVGPTETGQWRSMWARPTGCSRSPPSRAPRIYLTGLLVGEDAAYRRRKRRRRSGRGEKKKFAAKKKKKSQLQGRGGEVGVWEGQRLSRRTQGERDGLVVGGGLMARTAGSDLSISCFCSPFWGAICGWVVRGGVG